MINHKCLWLPWQLFHNFQLSRFDKRARSVPRPKRTPLASRAWGRGVFQDLKVVAWGSKVQAGVASRLWHVWNSFSGLEPRIYTYLWFVWSNLVLDKPALFLQTVCIQSWWRRPRGVIHRSQSWNLKLRPTPQSRWRLETRNMRRMRTRRAGAFPMTSDFIKYSNGQNVRKLDYERAEPSDWCRFCAEVLERTTWFWSEFV